MRTDKQNEASRRNGAKSRGPATGAGKQNSSRNAAKHHITSKALLVPGESAEALEAHFAEFRARFRPLDSVELGVVDNLAFIAWRQRRLWLREADLITTSAERMEAREPGETPPDRIAAEAWKFLAHGPCIALLQREEASLRRAFDRTLKNLIDLQNTRPDDPPPGPDAKLQNEPEPTPTAAGTVTCGAPPAAGAPVVTGCSLPAAAVSVSGIGTVPPNDPAPLDPHAAAAAKYHWSQC